MKDKAKQQPVEEIDMLRNEVESAVLDNEDRYRLIVEHVYQSLYNTSPRL